MAQHPYPYAQMAFCFLVGFVRVDSYALLACLRANVDDAYANLHGVSILLTASQIIPTFFINLLTIGGYYDESLAYAMIALSGAQLILACRWSIINDFTLSCASTPRTAPEEEEEEKEAKADGEIGLSLVWAALFMEFTYNTGELSPMGIMGLNLVLLVSVLIALMFVDAIEAVDYTKTLPPITWGMGFKILLGLVMGFFPETAMAQKVFFAAGCGLTTIFCVVAFYLHWIREPSLTHVTRLSVWMLGVCAFGVYTRQLDPGPFFWHLIFLGMLFTGLDYVRFCRVCPDEALRMWAIIKHNQFQSTNVLPGPTTNDGEVFMDEEEDEDLFSDHDGSRG
jgi:hypothetical protein